MVIRKLQQLAEAAAYVGSVPRRLREVMTAGEALQITPSVRSFFESTGARLFGHAMELASRLGASHDESELMERQTLARLEAALGPELLASELAAGAALSLQDAIDLAFAGGSPKLPE